MAAEPVATPLYFGTTGEPLFGWWHAPAGTALDTAVLLCPSYGREEVSGHRTLRRLAEQLSAVGFPVLRFDYLGTGDSAGDEREGDQTAAWLRSVHAALDELKRRAVGRQLAVIGLRLGALLAAQAASQREDVSALVTLAAVTSGRGFVREQKALQAASAARGAASAEADLLESGGYAMNSATREALSAIDLKQLQRAPAPRVLAIERDDMPASAAWLESVTRAGGAVEQQRLPGYAEAMQDPHNTRVPQAMLDAVRQWLSASATSGAVLPMMEAASSARIGSVLEQPVSVDAAGAQLSGILTSPADLHAADEAVLLVNAGAQRRIGPSRLYVSLARRWAAKGATVLRLDLSGLGDSGTQPGAPDNVVYSPTAVDEMAHAVRWLREHTQARRCSVVGLCSGAYHGLKAAVRGAPLDTVVAINPLTFFWHEGTPLDAPMPAHHVAAEMARYRANLFARERWLKLLKGQVDVRRLTGLLWRRVLQVSAGPAKDLARLLHLPMREDLAGELQRAARTGTQLHFVFSQGDPGEDLLRTEAGATVGRLQKRGALKIHRMPDADHTFTGFGARTRFAALLTSMLLASAAPLQELDAVEPGRTGLAHDVDEVAQEGLGR
jgi:pimeloyl-ACP methyl ester carboxylesterase